MAEADALHGSVLSGRDADLKVIRAFLGETSLLGGALLLTGEPGIGKSALLNAAQDMVSAAGVRVVRAGGVQFEADVSFAGLHQLALPLSDELERLGALHRDALNVALGIASGPPADRLVVSNAALALLRRAAAACPLIVIVDDLQWLDQASAFVLLFAARRLAGSHVGLLAAFRTGSQINQGDLVSHEVGPLDDLASASLVDSRFPGLPPQVRQRVLSEARGNPLALLELPAELGAPQRAAPQALPMALLLSRRAPRGSSGALNAAVAAAHLLLDGDGDIETAHRVLVDAITTRPGQSDAAVTGALQTLLMVCSFGERADLWAPFHDGMRLLAAAVPAELRLLASMCADPVRTAVGSLDQLDSAISSLTWETGQWRILTVCAAAEHADRLAGCREALWRVVRDSNDGGTALSAISALDLLSIAGFATGDWDATRETSEQCLRMCEARGYMSRAWTPRALHALLAAARGEYDTALTLNRQNIRWAMPRGIRQAQAAAHLAGSLAALGQGDFDAAYAEAAAISPPGVFASHAPYALRVPMTLVQAAVRTGRHAEAKAHVTAMREAGIARISPRLAMLADASAAIADPVHDAGRLFDAALSVPGADRWPFEFAQVQLAYGEHLRRARKTIEARVHLGAALATFRVLGARPWVDRADNELRATGLSVIRAEGHGSTVLTAQQQQIAALAAAGLTNKQIAQRLHLSHRTVADHLYQIFPKLGICTRAALRDALSARSPG